MIFVVGDPSTGTSAMAGALAMGGAPVRFRAMRGLFPFYEDNEACNDCMRLRRIRDTPTVLKVFPGNVIRCVYKSIIPTHVIVMRRPLKDAQESRALRFPTREWMQVIDGVELNRAVRLLHQAHSEVLEIQFEDLMLSPLGVCKEVAKFLPVELNVASMVSHINPERPWRDSYPGRSPVGSHAVATSPILPPCSSRSSVAL